MGILLFPAAVLGVLGLTDSAAFFAGAALYVGVCQWIGWLARGRARASGSVLQSFSADVFIGLALLCAWFYGRNLVERIWPGSFGLGELRLLAWMVPILHLLAGILRLVRRVRQSGFQWKELVAEARGDALISGAFMVCLVLTLGAISSALHVQSSDPMFHAYAARNYREHGIEFRPSGEDPPINYPSGFGALNTVAITVSPLSCVRAVNLQHTLLLLLALFLVCDVVSSAIGRFYFPIYLAPLVFLALFPVHDLYPDIIYQSTGRLAAPALVMAVVMLPLSVEAGQRRMFVGQLMAGALLNVLALGLNPAVAPFTLVAFLLGLALNLSAARRAGVPRWWAVLGSPLATAAVFGVFLVCDPFYRPIVWPQRDGSSTPIASADPSFVPADPPQASSSRFDLVAGIRFAITRNPLRLTPVESMSSLNPGEENLLDWPARIPLCLFPWLAAGSAACGLVLAWRQSPSPTSRMLARLVLAMAVSVLAFKYTANVLIGSVAQSSAMLQLLRIYVVFLLLRIELMFWFSLFLAALGLLVSAGSSSHRTGRFIRPIVGALCLFLCGVAALTTLGILPRSGLLLVRVNLKHFRVTADDVRLVEWCDEHIPAERGNIGLAAGTFPGGPRGDERHIYALYGGQAFLLYGRQGNYRFALSNLEHESGYEDYLAHIQKKFDPEWCLRNNIRFVYATPSALELNPGLAQAIKEEKVLRPLRKEGLPTIYEVVKEDP
jgi:hypothetical protein